MSAAPADPTRRPIVLATGGTGGHVFPAEALAEELAARGWPLALITDGRARRWGRALESHPIHTVSAASPSGSAAKRLLGIGSLALGFVQALRLMLKIRPAVVVGFGGYAAAPTVLAAQLLGVPTVLHEQNAVFGRSNRLVGARARRIAVSFDRVGRISDADPRIARIGNPVREAVRAIGERPYVPPASDGPIRLLVTGGSQGAASFAQVIPAAIASLAPDLRRRFVGRKTSPGCTRSTPRWACAPSWRRSSRIFRRAWPTRTCWSRAPAPRPWPNSPPPAGRRSSCPIRSRPRITSGPTPPPLRPAPPPSCCRTSASRSKRLPAICAIWPAIRRGCRLWRSRRVRSAVPTPRADSPTS
jgi:hypothetical protein